MLFLPSVIYYQGDQSDIPFVGEEVFKELEGTDEISRTYEVLNVSASGEDLQMNGNLVTKCIDQSFEFPNDIPFSLFFVRRNQI